MSSRYQYKETGLDWIGEIPSHWNLISLKNAFYVIPSNVDKRSEDDEIEVQLCNYVDVYYNDFISLSIDFMTATATEAEIKKFQLQLEDVLITKDSEDPFDIAVPAYVAEVKEKLLCGYHLSLLRSSNKKITGSYLFWALKDEKIITQLWREACGVTRWAIASRHIKNSVIPFPSKKEQAAISNYLNKTCADIDKVIELKKEQIEKLDDYEVSRIRELIKYGKGDVEFQDSGIIFIGKVPSHWKVDRLKFYVSKIGSGVTPKGGAATYVDEGVPLIRSQNVHDDGLRLDDVSFITEDVHEDMSNSQLQRDDVLLNITGASIGRCCIYELDDEANVNQHVCIIRPTNKIRSRFLHCLLISEVGQSQIFSGFTGSSREGLNFEEIKNFKIFIPPLNEQDDIIAKIEEFQSKSRKNKKIIEQQIETLIDYKKSLIHEVVTGKKQVYFEDEKTILSKSKPELTAVV